MYVNLKRLALFGSMLGLLLLMAGIIYTYNNTTYTANLDSRPFYAGLAGSVETLEPGLVSTREELLIASAIYEGLVYYDDAAGTLKPLLARNWKYSADGKSLIINLKQNVEFHNGKKMQANDVKASWEKNFSTTKDKINITHFLSITGSRERLEGKSTEISGIQVVDSSTIRVNFDQPNSSFIYMLVNPMFWVFDVDDSAGTGPFILSENKDNRLFKFSRFDNYHRGVPYLTGVEMTVFNDANQGLKEFQAGRLDYLDSIPLAEVKNIKASDQFKKAFVGKPVMNIYAVGFNVNKEPFAGNYLLRRAINYAIDRKAIADNVLGQGYRPLKGVIPVGTRGYNHDMPGYSYDPDKAKRLLEESGYLSKPGNKTLILSYNTDEGHRIVAESIAAQLSQIGLEVKLQAIEWNSYKNHLAHMDLAFFRIGWYADYPDADSFLYSLFHSSNIGISNFSGYFNPLVDKILEAARAETKSQQERLKLLNRAEEIIVDDAPFLWLFQKDANKLVGENVNSLNLDGREMIDWYKVQLVKPPVEEPGTPSPDTQKV
ncbi:MAG: ABC transporter substrate-binding protein [Syntrophomonadaceae bacterium]|jgi:oligopeptide transport system substrate-binding protein